MSYLNEKALWVMLLFLISLCSVLESSEIKLPSSVPGASHFLKKHPEADANKDGVLTHDEKESYCINLSIAFLGGDYSYERVMLPMRDGVKLSTAIFKPKKVGRYPVVLTRTSYGIWAAALFNGEKFKNKGIVYISQDLRGDGASEGLGTHDPASFDNEIHDGYDTIDWIAKQDFCNGSIGIEGQSGHGFCAYMAYLAKHPNLSAAWTNISGGNAYKYWTFHNGVRREMYNWLGNRNFRVPQWPRPTIELFDQNSYDERVKFATKNNNTKFIAITGWYDIFSESALDYFESFAHQGDIFIRVDASGHGGMRGRPFPAKLIPSEWKLPDFLESLKAKKGIRQKSRMVYYLMGDVLDKNAPGNVYKMTEVWPVPHVPTSIYMKQDGGLELRKPKESSASLSFKYDPNDPVPSEGGDVFIHKGVGPKDQRLLSKRKDILRFKTSMLTEPLEVTGKIKADLFVSTNVEDTSFTVKLIDIYPDGYQAIVRDSIMMGRFHEGFDRESRLEEGKVYKLSMDLWSTAYVFNKGHRIGVHISSSNHPKYEVHPNSFDPVSSYQNAPIAHNSLKLSGAYASRIVLPVVK